MSHLELHAWAESPCSRRNSERTEVLSLLSDVLKPPHREQRRGGGGWGCGGRELGVLLVPSPAAPLTHWNLVAHRSASTVRLTMREHVPHDRGQSPHHRHAADLRAAAALDAQVPTPQPPILLEHVHHQLPQVARRGHPGIDRRESTQMLAIVNYGLTSGKRDRAISRQSPELPPCEAPAHSKPR